MAEKRIQKNPAIFYDEIFVFTDLWEQTYILTTYPTNDMVEYNITQSLM